MTLLKCEFCDKKFTNKSNLNQHIKTAKYCINLRQTNEEKEGQTKLKIELKKTCTGCQEIFSNITNLNKHKLRCIPFITNEIKKQYDLKLLEQKEIYEKYIEEYKNKIEKLEEKINKKEDYQETLLKEAIKNKGDINTINNVNIQNNYNLAPLTDQLILEKTKNMKKEDVKNYITFGSYLTNNILQDSVRLTDKARLKMLCLDEHNNIIKDHGYVVITKVLKPIASKINDLSLEIQNDFKNKPNNEKNFNTAKTLNCTVQKIVLKQGLEGTEKKTLRSLLSEISTSLDNKKLENKNLEKFKIDFPDENIEKEVIVIADHEDTLNDSDCELSPEESRKRYLKIYNELDDKLINVGDTFMYTDKNGGWMQFEKKYNYYDNIERIYLKIGDHYADENEIIVHPVKFLKTDRFATKKQLERTTIKTINDLQESDEVYFPLNDEKFIPHMLWYDWDYNYRDIINRK